MFRVAFLRVFERFARQYFSENPSAAQTVLQAIHAIRGGLTPVTRQQRSGQTHRFLGALLRPAAT
jgi:hypothetical protein